MTRPEDSANPAAAFTERWRTALLGESATLFDGIRCLNESALQIVLVVTADNTLAGTLTDGDIRRGLLGGLNLQSSIESIIRREPLVVPPEMGRDSVLQLMQANKVHQLPVVDGLGRIVGLHSWDILAVPEERGNVMLMMVGGQGSRLRPHTESCPKPMLHVGGKPMLEHIIDRAKAEGFRNFVLAVHFLGHVIEDYFGDGSRWEVQIDYVREDSPLGTAGAIGLLTPRPTAPFVVSNGDVLTDIRYGELLDFHSRNRADATMAVRLHEWQHPFGVVKTKGIDIIGFDEKPVARTHINAGIYVLEPRVVDLLDCGTHCDMPALFARVQEGGGRAIVYPVHEPWLDVGQPHDLERAKNGRHA